MRFWEGSRDKKLAILRPGNQSGKSLLLACFHIWECMTKPRLYGRVANEIVWMETEYNTVNAATSYEVSKAVWHMIQQLCEGNLYVQNSGTLNNSQLKSWALTTVRENPYPEIHFWNGSKFFAKSLDDMGTGFKQMKFGYVSVDEAGDIDHLDKVLTGTLMPRTAVFNGAIHLVGTPQGTESEYSQLIDRGYEDPEMFVMGGSVMENPHISKDYVKSIENIADPKLKRQILFGEIVDYGDNFFDWGECEMLFSDKTVLPEELPKDGHKYVTAVDFAAGNDFFVMFTVDYTVKPYKIVHYRRYKGKSLPIPMQYELVEKICLDYKSYLVIDKTGLGGENARQFLRKSHPVDFDFSKPGQKAKMLYCLKTLLADGRKLTEDGIDLNKNFGLLRSYPHAALDRELRRYKLDDKRITQDTVMSLGMAAWYIDRVRMKGTVVKEFEILNLRKSFG